MRKIILSFIILGAALLSCEAFADTLYLRDGTQLEGMVVEETDEWVIFHVYGGKVKFQRFEISRIVKGPLKVEEPKPAAAEVGAPKTPAKVGKGVHLPDFKLSGIKATGWKGDILRRVINYIERQSNPRALIQNFSVAKLLLWLLEAVFVFLVIAFFIKLYTRLFGVSVPYGRACLFLFKFNLISNLVIIVFTTVGATAAASGPPGAIKPGQPIAVAAAILLVLGIFFWLADRDLESGFLKSIGLFVVIMFAYLLGGIAFSFLGLL